MTFPRTALVTGASSGLGRELVRQLVIDRQMIVLATARRGDRLQALARELPEGHVRTVAGDLADPEFRRRLWDEAETLPGGVDLLVNNAGLGDYSELLHQDRAKIRQIIEVNLIALIDLTQKAIAHMKPRGAGQILQISSILGYFGMADAAVYVATKHAVNGLVKSLRYELRGTGVRIWAACPARTESEFRQVAIANRGDASRTPRGEPTDRVVRAIVKGIDGRGAFLMPSLSARGVVNLAYWLPGPFDWMMNHWSPGSYRRMLEHARSDGESEK
jgi:short-subunit dehydrogenase